MASQRISLKQNSNSLEWNIKDNRASQDTHPALTWAKISRSAMQVLLEEELLLIYIYLYWDTHHDFLERENILLRAIPSQSRKLST